MSADTALLADIPLFALLDDAERFTVAGLLEFQQVPAGRVIFHAGDPGDGLFIVRRGRVRIFLRDPLGEAIPLDEHGPGDLFGELSLLDGEARTTSAEAIDDCELLAMDRDALLEVVRRHPHAALDLLTVTGRRLRETAETLRTRIARNPNVVEEESLTLGERIADRVAAFGGSWPFIFAFAVVLLVWMGLNALLLAGTRRFDPYPFILLNLVLSTLAAIQAPVIMMSQNRQAAKDRIKSDLDYQVNLKAELEVAELHAKVDRLYEVMQAHFAALERNHRLQGAPAPADRAPP